MLIRTSTSTLIWTRLIPKAQFSFDMPKDPICTYATATSLSMGIVLFESDPFLTAPAPPITTLVASLRSAPPGQVHALTSTCTAASSTKPSTYCYHIRDCSPVHSLTDLCGPDVLLAPSQHERQPRGQDRGPGLARRRQNFTGAQICQECLCAFDTFHYRRLLPHQTRGRYRQLKRGALADMGYSRTREIPEYQQTLLQR